MNLSISKKKFSISNQNILGYFLLGSLCLFKLIIFKRLLYFSYFYLQNIFFTLFFTTPFVKDEKKTNERMILQKINILQIYQSIFLLILFEITQVFIQISGKLIPNLNIFLAHPPFSISACYLLKNILKQVLPSMYVLIIRLLTT